MDWTLDESTVRKLTAIGLLAILITSGTLIVHVAAPDFDLLQWGLNGFWQFTETIGDQLAKIEINFPTSQTRP